MDNRILVVTNEYFNPKGVYVRSIIKVMKDIVGNNNVITFFPYFTESNACDETVHVSKYKEQNSIGKLFGLFKRLPACFTQESLKELNELIIKERINILIIGRSWQAGIIPYVNRNVKSITFFHDVMIEGIRERARKERLCEFAKSLPRIIIGIVNDSVAVKYSTLCSVYNERDKRCFVKHYNRIPDAVIPVFLEDKFRRNSLCATDRHICKLLFPGSYYWPNIIGIRWFITNVLSKLDDKFCLTVVGYGMERVKEEMETLDHKVVVVGTVDDLAPYYYDADVVVSPIFNGSGMKTKTTEALMYGKYYLGAPEALEGFEDCDEFLCRNSEDFIEKLICYEIHRGDLKFFEKSRSIYEKLYSEKAVNKEIKSLLDKCDLV